MGFLLTNNLTMAEGGGFTSKVVPKVLGKGGIAAGFALGGAATIGKEMFANHNRLKAGPMTYTGGLSRMTHKVSSGAIEAIQGVTNDPAIQADMIKKMMKNNDTILNSLEEFGVDGQFLSAFYGMGG